MPRRYLSKLYIAGPLRFESNRSYLSAIEQVVLRSGFKTWMPHRDAGFLSEENLRMPQTLQGILGKDIAAFHECCGAVFLLDNHSAGTILEFGYAYCLKKEIRKDFIIVGLYSSMRGLSGLDPLLRYCLDDAGFIATSLEDLHQILSKGRLLLSR
jgi:hypothetical protein